MYVYTYMQYVDFESGSIATQVQKKTHKNLES